MSTMSSSKAEDDAATATQQQAAQSFVPSHYTVLAKADLAAFLSLIRGQHRSGLSRYVGSQASQG